MQHLFRRVQPALRQMAQRSYSSQQNQQNSARLTAIIAAAGLAIPAVFYFDQVLSKKETNEQHHAKEEGSKHDKPGHSESTSAVADSNSAFSEKDAFVVFVLGGPGAGKGTQCSNLSRDYGFVHLSAGDLLRAERERSNSQYGELINTYIKEGKIVPMHITIALLKAAMEKAIAEPNSTRRFLIDGFPREFEQALEFEQKVCPSQFVLYYECPEQEMLKRLLNRAKTSGRSDDNEESIKKRFVTFRETSFPVIEVYQTLNKVKKISCLASPEEVYNETKRVFDAALAKNLIVYVSVMNSPNVLLKSNSSALLERLSHLEKQPILNPQSPRTPNSQKRASLLSAIDAVERKVEHTLNRNERPNLSQYRYNAEVNKSKLSIEQSVNASLADLQSSRFSMNISVSSNRLQKGQYQSIPERKVSVKQESVTPYTSREDRIDLINAIDQIVPQVEQLRLQMGADREREWRRGIVPEGPSSGTVINKVPHTCEYPISEFTDLSANHEAGDLDTLVYSALLKSAREKEDRSAPQLQKEKEYNFKRRFSSGIKRLSRKLSSALGDVEQNSDLAVLRLLRRQAESIRLEPKSSTEIYETLVDMQPKTSQQSLQDLLTVLLRHDPNLYDITVEDSDEETNEYESGLHTDPLLVRSDQWFMVLKRICSYAEDCMIKNDKPWRLLSIASKATSCDGVKQRHIIKTALSHDLLDIYSLEECEVTLLALIKFYPQGLVPYAVHQTLMQKNNDDWNESDLKQYLPTTQCEIWNRIMHHYTVMLLSTETHIADIVEVLHSLLMSAHPMDRHGPEFRGTPMDLPCAIRLLSTTANTQRSLILTEQILLRTDNHLTFSLMAYLSQQEVTNEVKTALKALVIVYHQDHQLVSLSKIMAQFEVMSHGSWLDIFGNGSIVTRFFAAALHVVAGDYIRNTMRPILNAIQVAEYSHYEIDIERCPKTSKRKFKQQISNFESLMDLTLSTLEDSVLQLPRIVSALFYQLYSVINARFADARFPWIGHRLVTLLFFRHLVSAALLSPFEFGSIQRENETRPEDRQTMNYLATLLDLCASHKDLHGCYSNYRQTQTQFVQRQEKLVQRILDNLLVSESEQVLKVTSNLSQNKVQSKLQCKAFILEHESGILSQLALMYKSQLNLPTWDLKVDPHPRVSFPAKYISLFSYVIA